MKMLAGEIVSLAESLLERLTKTPPAGAGCANVTWKRSCSPGISVRPDGILMSGPDVTVTVALAPVTLGADALMVAVPGPTPVTGTLTLEALPAKDTLAGTVTAPVLPDVRFTVKPPAGAAGEMFNVSILVPT